MRDTILNKIKPALKSTSLPDLQDFNSKGGPDLNLLKSRVEETGSTFYEIENTSEIEPLIKKIYPESKKICDATNSLNIGNVDPITKDKSILDKLDVCIVKARFIVEENGAVWVTEEDIKNRILLCIPEHLVVIVDKNSVLGNMHDAYQNIDSRNHNYGVFVCGPSKTADIAQTLVIGAHGPKSMAVVLY